MPGPHAGSEAGRPRASATARYRANVSDLRPSSDGLFYGSRSFVGPMNDGALDMEEVTLELTEEELEAIDEKAFAEHRDNREAAIRDLLDEWLKEREE